MARLGAPLQKWPGNAFLQPCLRYILLARQGSQEPSV